MEEFEFGVVLRINSKINKIAPVCAGLTEDQAKRWIEIAEKTADPNAFVVIRRPIVKWEVAP